MEAPVIESMSFEVKEWFARAIVGMIKIYFKKYEEAGDYLNFVKNYDRSRAVAPGSPEYRVLNQVLRPLANAWQDRAEYAHDILSDFHHDDLV